MLSQQRWIRAITWGLAVAAPLLVQAAESSPERKAALEFFERKIRPLLAENCYNCHSANTNARGGLRLDDLNGMLQGGNRGAAVVPGEPDKSLLLRAVQQTDKLKMPPMKRLSDEEIADLTQWIRDGAAWPAVRIPFELTAPKPEFEQLRKEHWAWQPLATSRVPAVQNSTWPRHDIDRFVLARLEKEGLAPVPDADKPTLLRRVTFDLTGLPPTPAEMDAFLADSSPQAFEQVVDRLLASPAYAERWGRHWLDLARYGESTGSARNLPYPHAWRYRDYVIDSFQRDKPYDQFLREQIAGDLLPAESPAQRDEQLIATGFLAIGVKDVNQRFKVRYIMDNIDEQIDTLTRSVLALTVSCARCHDHKFDPITTSEYYSLAGIFHSTDLCAGLRNKMGGGGLDYYDTAMLLRLGSGTGPSPAIQAKIDQARAELEEARAELLELQENPRQNAGPEGKKALDAARKRVTKVQTELVTLSDPALNGPVAMGVRDASHIGDTEIRIRGVAEKLGPVAPRGFLALISLPDAPSITPQQSGRLQLAHWLTSPHNPLTPRVITNRIWQHLFGQGLVISVDNFGTTGDKPSHPELLDHLATRFIDEGWSIKTMVRTLVLTRAYQLGTAAPASHMTADPGNRLVWRHSPRRLAAEEMRDTILAISGKLNLTRPQGSRAKDLKVVEIRNDGAEARTMAQEAQSSTYRSVYLPLLRGLTPRAMEVFDFAEQGMVTGSRDSTTVATQALYLLNDPFIRQQSQAFAERLRQQSDLDDTGRIALAYRLALGREATSPEISRAQSYLAQYIAEARKLQGPAKGKPGAKGAGKKPPPGTNPAPANPAPANPAPANPAPANPAPANPAPANPANTPAEDDAPALANPQLAAWASFCQALLGSAEFRYVR